MGAVRRGASGQLWGRRRHMPGCKAAGGTAGRRVASAAVGGRVHSPPCTRPGPRPRPSAAPGRGPRAPAEGKQTREARVFSREVQVEWRLPGADPGIAHPAAGPGKPTRCWAPLRGRCVVSGVLLLPGEVSDGVGGRPADDRGLRELRGWAEMKRLSPPGALCPRAALRSPSHERDLASFPTSLRASSQAWKTTRSSAWAAASGSVPSGITMGEMRPVRTGMPSASRR